ncbi:MAG: glycoside hydrolase family 15 protein [Verrucomicrobiota bacterium JB022]|nr:glycoside hydrolase family 15 protein [Verrucomicrobiota bacterium JB022]
MSAPFTAEFAPGKPGVAPRWSSTVKDGVGTAFQRESLVWFTLGQGVVKEVFYPTIDTANLRDTGFLVTGPDGFFSEERVDTEHETQILEPGVPFYQVTNTCKQGRYRIHKEIICHPAREVLLQRVRFEALQGRREDYRLYQLINPHLRNSGAHNNALAMDIKGRPYLCAERQGVWLVAACDRPWLARSVGYVGVSDGWQQLKEQGELQERYHRAPDGNVALCGEIELGGSDEWILSALSFGRSAAEGAHHAHASIIEGWQTVCDVYTDAWRDFLKGCSAPDLKAADQDLLHTSRMVLRVHDGKQYPGALVASLSYPWGSHEDGNSESGGYHLVWPRDLAEAALGYLAVDDPQSARQSLIYLLGNQEEDGRWAQNMWLDGSPYWTANQSDETAYALLLAEVLHHADVLKGINVWPAVRKAAEHLLVNGPGTAQDRWEEVSGYPIFTLAAEVAGLIAGAHLARAYGDDAFATLLEETADDWNAFIDDWLYVTDTALTRELEIDGFYPRTVPFAGVSGGDPAGAKVTLANRMEEPYAVPAGELSSADALSLVWLGLRHPNDPRIENTLKAIDATTRCETKAGPGWYRYRYDGYGERPGGEPFEEAGIGRPWPLLTAERANFELTRGNRDEAKRLYETVSRMASRCGLLAEQVWDEDDIPEKCLFNGQPTGSATPLVWAHSSFLQLSRSLHEGKVFGWAPSAHARYVGEDEPPPARAMWRFDTPVPRMQPDRTLRLMLTSPARVRYTTDGWKSQHDLETQANGAIHWADLPTEDLEAGAEVVFTFYWTDSAKWEGKDFTVRVQEW